MSEPNQSDPRLRLPEWLRDGDVPLPAPVETKSVEQPVAVATVEKDIVAASAVSNSPAATSAMPYSDRLSLDTRLDPKLLVSAEDLPAWLGGLERATIPNVAVQTVTTAASQVPIDEPEPYEGVDAPQEGVIDIEVNGWYLIAGALGLFILLAAALRLYLS